MKKLMRKKLALMLANLRKKSPYYCEVEYLESSGTQYIDTGISAPSGYRGIVTLAPLANETATLVGTQLGGKSNRLLTNSGRIKIACASTTYFGASFTVGTKYDIDFCTEENYYLIVDGVEANSGTNTNGRSAGNLYVFAGTRQSAVGYFSKMKLYCLKLYVGDVLVRDYIPVLDWNRTPCLYDKVSGQLFYNAGTGDFTYGREIHYVDYLESTGTQYIDTGYVPNNTTGILAKFGIVYNGLDNIVIGCRQTSGDTRFLINNDASSSAEKGIECSFNTVPTANTGQRYKIYASDAGRIITASLNYKNNRLGIVEGTTYTNYTSVSLANITYPIWIFGANFYGGFPYPFKGKIYNAQITQDQYVIRGYYPAIDENNVGFMFNKVNHTIYDNAGTGSFVAGSIIEPNFG